MFLKAKIPEIKKMDFNGSLITLRQNVELFFLDHEVRSSLHSKLERARVIRNKYSHQDFDVDQ